MRICKSIDDAFYTSSVRDTYTLVYTPHHKMPTNKYAMGLDHIFGFVCRCRCTLFSVFSLLVITCVTVNVNETGGRHLGQNFAPWLLNCAFSHMPVVAFLIPHHQSQSLLTRLFSISDWIPVWSAVLLLSYFAPSEHLRKNAVELC